MGLLLAGGETKCNSHWILSLRFLFDNGEERFTFHPLLLLQLIEFLSEDVLMPLSQSAQHRSNTHRVNAVRMGTEN